MKREPHRSSGGSARRSRRSPTTFSAGAFYEAPRTQWLAAFAGDRLFEAWPFPSGDDRTAAGLALLTEFCQGWNPGQLGTLTWDFNRLFVGPGEMLAAPWESVYRSKTKLTFQESTLQVRELYERFGVQAPAMHREPDDHLGLELAFVATLSDLAARAAAAAVAPPAHEVLRNPEGLPAGPPACLGSRVPGARREARGDRLLSRRGASWPGGRLRNRRVCAACDRRGDAIRAPRYFASNTLATSSEQSRRQTESVFCPLRKTPCST